MSVIASSIVEDRTQIDGRRHVTEEHRTDNGKKIFVMYMAEEDADVETRLGERVPKLEEQLEADKVANEFIAQMNTCLKKEKEYYGTLTDEDVISTLNITSEEVKALRELKK